MAALDINAETVAETVRLAGGGESDSDSLAAFTVNEVAAQVVWPTAGNVSGGRLALSSAAARQ